MATTPPCDALAAWQAQYPNPAASAEQNAALRADEQRRLTQFTGLDALDREHAEALIGWKFQSMPHRKARALSGVTSERWQGRHGAAGAAEIIREALAAPGDYQPLLILSARSGVYGFGPAMGSVVLAACRPEKFTIADTRALKSLRALGLMPTGPKSFRLKDWDMYLEVCRRLARSCHMSLREVDQALWVAADDPALPDLWASERSVRAEAIDEDSFRRSAMAVSDLYRRTSASGAVAFRRDQTDSCRSYTAGRRRRRRGRGLHRIHFARSGSAVDLDACPRLGDIRRRGVRLPDRLVRAGSPAASVRERDRSCHKARRTARRPNSRAATT